MNWCTFPHCSLSRGLNGRLRVLVRVTNGRDYVFLLFFRGFVFRFVRDLVLLMRYRGFLIYTFTFRIIAVTVMCFLNDVGRLTRVTRSPRARRFNGQVIRGVATVAVLGRLTRTPFRRFVARCLVNRR